MSFQPDWRSSEAHIESAFEEFFHAASRRAPNAGAAVRPACRGPDARLERAVRHAILADLGARVIKVGPPGHGDDTRTYGPFVKGQSLYFSFINRGKESIVLNLREDHDRAIFRNMLKRADVVTENFRAGTMDRLGFSYAELSKDNPRLIYASSSGYGHTGPVG
jgi:CoA-transferase family III